MTELKSCLEHLDDLGGNKLFGSILAALAPQNQQNLTQVNIVESNTGVTPVQEPPK
jgi:hypothetical protein